MSQKKELCTHKLHKKQYLGKTYTHSSPKIKSCTFINNTCFQNLPRYGIHPPIKSNIYHKWSIMSCICIWFVCIEKDLNLWTHKSRDSHTLWKTNVLQLALQFNFYVAKDTYNSLYLYIGSVNGQVAWVAKLQSTIYTMQLITTQL
jgi:hypothetical protein